MKNKKLIILVSLLLSLAIFSTACSNKIEEKVGKKIGEKIVEKATGGDVSIDDEDGVSVETEEGSIKAGDDLGWPEDKMKSLPKPSATINTINDSKEENAIMVGLAFEKEDGGSDYMEKLIDAGYIQTALTKSEDYVQFSGVKDDNTAVIYSYYPTEKAGSLMLLRENDASKEFFEARENENEEDEEPLDVDMSESMDWPKDSMDDIPAIEAQITGVSLNQNNVSIEYKGIRKKGIIAYIEEIKDLGFDKGSNETITDNFISYTASNDMGKSISVSWTDNEGFINYTDE